MKTPDERLKNSQCKTKSYEMEDRNSQNRKTRTDEGHGLKHASTTPI